MGAFLFLSLLAFKSTRVGRWGGVRAPLGVRRAVASPPPSPPASPRALFVSFFTGLVRAHHWHTNRGKDFTLGTLSQPRQCQTVDTLVSSVDTPGAPATKGPNHSIDSFLLDPRTPETTNSFDSGAERVG